MYLNWFPMCIFIAILVNVGIMHCVLIICQFSLDVILNLLEEKYFSPPGSTANVKEQNTYIFFKDLLEEIESE